MAFITWKAEYSVGNSEIDLQHQKLIEMINQLHDAMKMGKGSTEVHNIVREMIDYAKKHFSFEENLMRQHHYANLNEHVQEHQAFSKKVQDLEAKVGNGTLNLSVEVAIFLKDWLNHHILVVDKAYSVMFTRE